MARKVLGKPSYRRAEGLKRVRNRILLVVEGRRTEKNYFVDLLNTERLSAVRVEVVSSEKTNPIGIVSHAKKLIECGTNRFYPRSFDCVFIVFDHDGRDKEYFDAIELTNKLNLRYKNESKKSIHFVAIASNPNFELWFLLHYVRIFPHEMTSSDVLRELLKYWPQYQKNTEETYQATKENLAIAKSNAKKLRESHDRTKQDVITYVDILVEKLTREL